MAPNAAPAVAAIAVSQQAQQAALVSLMERLLDNAWSLLDTSDPSTMPTFLTAVRALVHRFAQGSGAQAAKGYMAERSAAGVRGSFRPRIASVPAGKVDTSVRWATQGLWQPEPDLPTIRASVGSVAEKSVLDVGRQTIIDGVHADSMAKGWARETEPGCCSFCALLATRGAAYRTEAKAAFESHDNCRCFAVPTFTEYEPTAQVREWQALYKSSTRGVRGPAAQRNAFRVAFAHGAQK